MTTAPIFAYPDFSKEFIVQVDASEMGTGATLAQLQDGRERVISYASQSLDDSQCRLCAIEREALAVMFAVQQFHPYLRGRTFKLFTDHNVFTYITQSKVKNEKLFQFASTLQEFNFEVKHKTSNANTNADTLS